MLIHTVPKCINTVDNISTQLNEELNEREMAFLRKMNRLKAFVVNYKIKYEI
jgi:hypothetical protein